MLSKVRKLIRDRSPDWLNVEVNKDLFHHFKEALTPSQLPLLIENEGNEESVTSVILPPKVEENEAEALFTIANGSTQPGKPHWRRIKQVFEILDSAPPTASYKELINRVRETTGKGCSRKLISKWKKQRRPESISTCPILSEFSTLSNEIEAVVQSANSMQIQNLTISQETLVQPLSVEENSGSLFSIGWSYIAATAIMALVVGCDWIMPSDNQTTTATAETVGQETTPLTLPKKKEENLEPSSIKISLTLSNPQDLKVKTGDKVVAGQTLSDRIFERSQLLAKKKQLQLSDEKLNLPLPGIIPPRPIPEINKLPPVSYASQEAAIKLKQQKLKEAEHAIANQSEKIKQIRQVLTNSSQTDTKASSNSPLIKQANSNSPLRKGDWKESIPVEQTVSNSQTSPLELIISHEEAVLKKLVEAKKEAQIQLELAVASLNTAKENRAYAEYQRQLEETKRAIAVEQQWLELQQSEAERKQQLQERELNKAQISAQIQEIDYQISQLSTVTAPYEGTIKKVKWTGQSDHTLTVELTLDVLRDSTSQSESGNIGYNR